MRARSRLPAMVRSVADDALVNLEALLSHNVPGKAIASEAQHFVPQVASVVQMMQESIGQTGRISGAYDERRIQRQIRKRTHICHDNRKAAGKRLETDPALAPLGVWQHDERGAPEPRLDHRLGNVADRDLDTRIRSEVSALRPLPADEKLDLWTLLPDDFHRLEEHLDSFVGLEPTEEQNRALRRRTQGILSRRCALGNADDPLRTHRFRHHALESLTVNDYPGRRSDPLTPEERAHSLQRRFPDMKNGIVNSE